jgi:hypothetical protein
MAMSNMINKRPLARRRRQELGFPMRWIKCRASEYEAFANCQRKPERDRMGTGRMVFARETETQRKVKPPDTRRLHIALRIAKECPFFLHPLPHYR